MDSVVRLLLLALVASAAIAQPQRGGRGGGGRGGGGGGRRPSLPDFAKLFAIMKESGCLPEDITEPQYSECESMTSPLQKLQCIANASGISGASGYDQASAETHIDSLSSDTEWRANQKVLFSNCSSIMPDKLPSESQGVFVMTCAFQLTLADCTEQRLVEKVVAVDSEKGEDVAEQVALMAGGYCFHRGLKYPEKNKKQWEDCASEAGLDMDKLSGAFIYYKMLAKGSDDLPEISAENITTVAAELENLDSAVACYTQASGEANSDGTINYEQITATIDSSKGRRHLKEAAKKITSICQAKKPKTIEEFHECYLEAQRYACAAIRSYGIATGLLKWGQGRKG